MKLSKDEIEKMKKQESPAHTSRFSKLADFNPPDSPPPKKEEEEDDPNAPSKFD